MSVELSLICQGVTPTHEFIKTFADPVDWEAVNRWIKAVYPRCEEHPELTYYDCE